MTSSLPSFTRASIAEEHASPTSLYVVIDAQVYDLTDFADGHPGGAHVLHQVAGQDATSEFYSLHRQEVLQRYTKLVVGTVEGETSAVLDVKPGELCPVPYAEPMWLSPEFAKSPYYDESHRRLQAAARLFVDMHFRPEALQIEESGERPSGEIIKMMSWVVPPYMSRRRWWWWWW
jgi:predicted heme/steroid binding protein